MMEEDIKKVIVDMIASGELDINIDVTHTKIFESTYSVIELTIDHKTENGYGKRILSKVFKSNNY